MDDFLQRWRIQIVAFLLVVIAGGVVVLVARWPRSTGMTELAVQTGRSTQATLPAIRTVERQLKVYVVGEVRQPGVYTFRDGERVEDAIKAAGGATADADLSRLNLAQRLRDEGYITVPNKNPTPVPASGSSSPASPQSGKVNLNTAALAQLDALPGIGATYAQRILDYRAKNGPFQRADDLVTLKIIPQSTFDKIKDVVDVK
jgi:competence protein ComEA